MLGASQAETVVRDTVLRVKREQREALRAECMLSIDYLNDRQIRDVEDQLFERFPSSQEGDSGQEIQPAALPLTQRYVAEAATLYSRGVQYYLAEPASLEESDATRKLSSELMRALDEIHYQETMHANERYTVLLRTCCTWFQIHRKTVRPVITFPHNVFPVLPPLENAAELDPADWNDYPGYVVETEYDKEVVGSAEGHVYAHLTDKDTRGFLGTAPDEPTQVLAILPHPFKRNPLVFWHTEMPVGELVIHGDATIARVNRELNIGWSLLWDTMRFQSYATPVKKVANVRDPGARQTHGARFPAVLGLEESFEYASADAPYSDLLTALREWVKMCAILMRQNPEDFSFDAPSAVSGFSKLVSSLPKMEARKERAVRARAVEQEEALPRVIAGLVATGKLSADALKLAPRVRYADIEFPQTPEEEAKSLETKFKHNLSTPVKELARMRGISLEQARSEIEANAEENDELLGSEQPPGQGPGQALDMGKRDLFSSLINGGAKNKADMQSKKARKGFGAKGANTKEPAADVEAD